MLAVAGAKAAPPQFVVMQCGEVLDVPGAEYVLQGDLTCQQGAADTAGLTIVADGIHLKLNGYTLRAGLAVISVGVRVQSHNVTITQGAILDFAAGVLTDPAVAQLTMKDVTLVGEILLMGQSHTLKGSDITGGTLGLAGTDHVVKGNTLFEVLVLVRPEFGGVASSIDIVGNQIGRLSMEPGADAVVLRDNVAADSLGIDVCGSNHVISDNTVTVSSGRFIGLRVGNGCAASAVIIKNNTLTAPPGTVGILLGSGATDAFVTRNTAAGFSSFDFQDDSPNCGTNTWTRNTFGTASQSCIQ